MTEQMDMFDEFAFVTRFDLDYFRDRTGIEYVRAAHVHDFLINKGKEPGYRFTVTTDGETSQYTVGSGGYGLGSLIWTPHNGKAVRLTRSHFMSVEDRRKYQYMMGVEW